MLIICPTCRGKRTIDDPTVTGAIMYCDQQGNRVPQVTCQSCAGSGWCEDGSGVKRAPIAPTEEEAPPHA